MAAQARSAVSLDSPHHPHGVDLDEAMVFALDVLACPTVAAGSRSSPRSPEATARKALAGGAGP